MKLANRRNSRRVVGGEDGRVSWDARWEAACGQVGGSSGIEARGGGRCVRWERSSRDGGHRCNDGVAAVAEGPSDLRQDEGTGRWWGDMMVEGDGALVARKESDGVAPRDDVGVVLSQPWAAKNEVVPREIQHTEARCAGEGVGVSAEGDSDVTVHGQIVPGGAVGKAYRGSRWYWWGKASGVDEAVIDGLGRRAAVDHEGGAIVVVRATHSDGGVVVGEAHTFQVDELWCGDWRCRVHSRGWS